MRLWPRSLMWRTVVIVGVVLIVSHLALLGVSSYQQRQAVMDARTHQAAEQIALAVRTLDNTAFAMRPRVLSSLKGPGFRAVLSDVPLLKGTEADRHFKPMASLLSDVLGPPARQGMVVRLSARVPWVQQLDKRGRGPMMPMMEGMHRQRPWWRDRDDHDDDDDDDDDDKDKGRDKDDRDDDADLSDRHHPHAERLVRAWSRGPLLAVSLPLTGGGWVNAAVPLNVGEAFWTLPNLRPFFLAGLLLAGVAVWVAWRAVRPLDAFARAAERLGRDMDAPPLPEKGPAEVRRAASAFNGMQARIRSFVNDRTRMLAAITHDLRTPITRMKLRAELMDDEEARAKMLADLDEMEAMVNATLAFARDEGAGEPMQPFDVAATLQAVCDDAEDAGGEASYSGPDRVVIEGRALAMKRAFANLVGNAVNYGGQARVTLKQTETGLVMTVDDDGPGLPDDQLDAVFKPFHRAETSRSRDTGGVGLGLSVVRAIITAHGGEVTLENRPDGGLTALVRLPSGAV